MSKLVETLLLTTLTAITAFSVFWYFKRKHFVFVGKLKKIIIYPVKSLPGIKLGSALLTKTGIKYNGFYDRGYILVTEKNEMITQRTKPLLSLLKTSFREENEFWIESATQKPLVIKINEDLNQNDAVVHTNVFGQAVDGVDCGEDAAQWFQEYLNIRGCRLLRHVPQLKHRPAKIHKDSKIVFGDQYPLRYQDSMTSLVVNDNSVVALNSRLPTDDTVVYKNFRPNLLVESEPFAEDKWDLLKIGNLLLKRQKACTRCILTTVNTVTGQMSSEPLASLKKFRNALSKTGQSLYGNSPLFGVGFGVEYEGEVTVGEDVFAANFSSWKSQL